VTSHPNSVISRLNSTVSYSKSRISVNLNAQALLRLRFRSPVGTGLPEAHVPYGYRGAHHAVLRDVQVALLVYCTRISPDLPKAHVAYGYRGAHHTVLRDVQVGLLVYCTRISPGSHGS